MKARDIREMSSQEIETKHKELKEALFNLRFQHEIGQLENPQKLKQTKRDIARLQTILKEQQASTQTQNENVKQS